MYKSNYTPDIKVEHSFEKFADLIGYKDSKYRDEFIHLLNQRYSFLHKFQNFSRYSRFWIKNENSLKERNIKIRESLNKELLFRKNAKVLDYNPSTINISSLASFVFCPVSFAIVSTFETKKSDELSKSTELRDDKFLEEFLKRLIFKRKLDFLYKKMKLDKSFTISDDYNKSDNHIFHLEYKDYYLKDDSCEPITVNEKKYYDFLTRGDYGELITSKITFRGHNHDIYKAFHSKKFNVSGIPDYIMQKNNGDKFLLLEKHSWQKEAINKPFKNHLIQAGAYIYLLPQLDLKYGYILYLQSIKIARLHKVVLSNQLKSFVEEKLNEIENFMETKKSKFDINFINVKKCFGCSLRMYCNHKNGKYSTIKIPYRIN